MQLHARHQHEPTLGLPRARYLGSHLGHLVLDLDLLILELTSVLSLVGELLLLSLDHCFMLLHQLQHLGVTPFGKQTRSTSAQNHLSHARTHLVHVPLGVRFGLGRLRGKLRLELPQLVLRNPTQRNRTNV